MWDYLQFPPVSSGSQAKQRPVTLERPQTSDLESAHPGLAAFSGPKALGSSPDHFIKSLLCVFSISTSLVHF